MKKLFIAISAFAFIACNDSGNSSNKPVTDTGAKEPVAPSATQPGNYTPSTNVSFTVDGKEIKCSGSILVSKDKDKLKPGNDYFVMLTASGGENKEGITLNFLMDTKAGTYPVVGSSFHRGTAPNDQMFGGLLGGKPKITSDNVTITECTDMGSNNMGGHKWKIAGTFESLTIPAMGIMLMDKTKNHPKEIKLEKGSFSNLTFDDNWEQMMEEGMKKMKEMKNK